VKTRYRVWIVQYEGERPDRWSDVPPGAVAIEPAEPGTLCICKARRYVEAFNRATWEGPRPRWAVAVPVELRYQGDLEPGTPFVATADS
jgi:hypothetical protein